MFGRISVAILAAAVVLTRPVAAQPPDKAEKVEKEKTVSFVFEDKPWPQVLDWFAKESGLLLVTTTKPTGSLTLKSDRQYTIPEVIDLLNDALSQQKFILIRREQSFSVFPADEKIQIEYVSRITPDQLPKRGRSEYVQVVVPIKTLTAEDIVPQLKKLISNFGEVAPFGSNQIIITDKAGNIRNIVEYIKELDEDKAVGDSFTYQCKFVKAQQAAETLRTLLADEKTQVTSPAAQPGAYPGYPYGGYPQPDPRSSSRGGSSSSGIGPRFRSIQIAVQEASNTILITGPADKLTVAKKLLEKLDVGGDGQKPRPNGPPVLKTYSVPAGTADAITKTLTEAYKVSPTTRITAVGNSQIMVYAGPADHFDIIAQLKDSQDSKPAVGSEFVPLTILDPAKTAESLKSFLGGGGLQVEAQTEGASYGVLLRGTAEQIRDAKDYLKARGESIGTGVGSTSGPIRVINVDNGNAAILAKGLAEMMRNLGKNPIEVIGGQPEPKKPEPKPMSEKLPPTSRLMPDDRITTPGGERPVSAQLVDPLNPPKKEPAPLPGKKPLTITVANGRLILTSEDPEALDLATQLARLLTDQKAGEAIYEVIRLKNVAAEDAAKIISEVFNGPAQPAQGGGGRGQGGGGFNPLQMLGAITGIGGGTAAPTNPSPGRIRVVAEKNSNSLIVVKASPLDLLTIRTLLQNSIDSNEPPEGGVMKTNLIALQHAKAAEVAVIIRGVYKTATGGGTSAAGQNRQAFPFPFAPQPAASGGSSAPALTVEADETSNKLVVMCGQALFEDIKKLCEELDSSAKDSAELIQIVPVRGVSPSQVAAALDALMGRTTTPQRPNTGTGGGMTGTPGVGGLGSFPLGGGGNPFGGGGNPFGGGGGISRPGGGGGNPFGGGGGIRPGGGGGGRGGSRRSAETSDGRGRDFFDYRDTDVPSAPATSSLYDPETDPTPLNLKAVAHQEPAPAQPTPPDTAPNPRPLPPAGTAALPPPAGDVRVQPLEELGFLIVRGRKPQDIADVIKFLDLVVGNAKETEIVLEIVPLEKGDATQIVNTLTQIYSRLAVGAGTSSILSNPNQRTPFGGAAFTTPGGIGIAQGQQQLQTAGSLLIFPLPRFNSILLAVPKPRVPDIVKEIKKLDQASSEQMKPVAYQLRKASAQVVSQQIQNFFNQRYPGEQLAQNQVRVNFDASSNTVYVQAGPADQKDIADLIYFFDTRTSASVNEVKVFRLRNAFADEMSQTLLQALLASVVNPLTSASGTSGVGGGGLGGGGAIGQFATGGFGQAGGGLGGGGLGGLGGGGLGGGGLGGGARPGATGTLTGNAAGLTTKTTSLRFFSAQAGQAFESGYLEDVHITPDARINALIVAASSTTMKLLEALIMELDGVSAAKSFVNVFPLKKADALSTANLLTQLFSGSAAGGRTGGVGQAGGLGGLGGFGQGGLGGGLGGLGGGATGGTGTTRPLLTLTGSTPDGATLIDLRITADARTNTLIVAGSRNDLDTINAIIARLEDADAPQLRTAVYKLRNAAAADVAQAVSTFITQQATLANQQFQAVYQTISRNTVIVAEPVSNTLLITAASPLFDDIYKMVCAVDAPPPQVMVSVLIAEVVLSNREEFGVEVGLQSPILFARSTANATPGTPGFNFNTTAAAPGSPTPPGPGLPNSNLFQQGSVGFQGLGNLGVGRAGANGVGGFVFSAASDSVNILIRALKVQGRVDIMSRPQLMLTDNQTGFFQVGQSFPLLGNAVLATGGLSQQSINYVDTGIVLRVTPRISPDGRVLMRVEPQISAPNPTPVSLGGGLQATAIDIQQVQTTVLAADGETVVLGGLIRKTDTKQENKIPWLGDLPWVGAAFRYRTQDQQRRELIFIMTPHLIRNEADKARVTAEEAKKMHWSLKDVDAIHGHGMSVLSGQPLPSSAYWNPNPLNPQGMEPGYPYTQQPVPGTPGMTVPPGVVPQGTVPGPVPGIQPGGPLPPPRTVPGDVPFPTPPQPQPGVPGLPTPMPGPVPQQQGSIPPVSAPSVPTAAGPPTITPPPAKWAYNQPPQPWANQPVTPAGGTPPTPTPAKEGQEWNVFRR